MEAFQGALTWPLHEGTAGVGAHSRGQGQPVHLRLTRELNRQAGRNGQSREGDGGGRQRFCDLLDVAKEKGGRKTDDLCSAQSSQANGQRADEWR